MLGGDSKANPSRVNSFNESAITGLTMDQLNKGSSAFLQIGHLKSRR
jgi:hypothetical protein